MRMLRSSLPVEIMFCRDLMPQHGRTEQHGDHQNCLDPYAPHEPLTHPLAFAFILETRQDEIAIDRAEKKEEEEKEDLCRNCPAVG